MVITFDELRKVKDDLHSGSMQRIADELELDVEIIKNFFGGTHYEKGSIGDVHFEKGVGGGVVKIEDTQIWDCAIKLLEEQNTVLDN